MTSKSKAKRVAAKNMPEISQFLFVLPLCATFQQNSPFYQRIHQAELEKLLTSHPERFKHCKLKMESQDLAYARPLKEPNLLIIITGRDNVGRSFPGDEVCVEILPREPQSHGEELLTGNVVGLMRRTEKCCTFMCRMENVNQRLVTPVKENMTKIRILQKRPDKIEIRKLVHPQSQHWVPEKFVDMHEDQFLVVRVLKWDSNQTFPLGTVTEVLSQKDYLDGMLQVEFSITRRRPSLEWKDEDLEEKYEVREDLRHVLTFTVDSEKAEDLDDAISVMDNGETYTIAVHITDVASYVEKDSDEDQRARRQGRTFYHPTDGNHAFMLSRNLSFEHLSLLKGEERKAISLITIINKSTNMMESCYFTLSVIKCNERLSYEKVDTYIQECLDSEAPLGFSKIKDCVAIAYRFTEVHRRWRQSGCWCQGHRTATSDLEKKGEGRSHCMVAELMHLYNSAVAEELISSELTQALTPLRCHREPDVKLLEQFKNKYSALLPFSAYLSQVCVAKEWQGSDEEEIDTKPEPIEAIDVLMPVFDQMEALAKKRNFHNLVHLICLDDIHPTLHPMAKEFKEIQRKAEILRYCSTPSSRLGHYGLQLKAYTWATSPMRRYVDMILQRLLHTVLSKKRTQYKKPIKKPIKINPQAHYLKADIDQFCEAGMERLDCALDYDLEELRFINETKSSTGDVVKLVIVDQLSPKSHNFFISFLLDKISSLPVMYRNLKVVEQPEDSKDRKSITLRWKRRLYSFTDTYKPQPQSHLNRNVVSISAENWKALISSVEAEDWDKVRMCLRDARLTNENRDGRLEEMRRNENENRDGRLEEMRRNEQDHFKTFTLKLELGKVLQVQLGTDVANRVGVPRVNLFSVSPSFDICLEHARNPTMCFSKDVSQASKTVYQDFMEYRQIWGDLCQMDTAYNAVEENDSVILENVSITWQNSQLSKGFFEMTQNQKKQWLLGFDITTCYLCIRLRNPCIDKETKAKQPSGSSLPDLQRSLPFTWVAHGVAIKPRRKKGAEMDKSSIIRVQFEIKLRNTQVDPADGFKKDTKFTVEVIPKKIPYVLREQAIANIKHANELVKSIAIGKPYTDFCRQQQLSFINHKLKLQSLNHSQERAVQEALQNPFTLIQGPPGTGKTVVGVHITYQFYEKNKMAISARPKQPHELETGASAKKQIPKKCGILYCGPSNKAVDIVAEQFLKLKDTIKPLRIYCDQMEMREFPYPGSDLRLCRQTLRDERTKDKLRDINLMYRVREPDNPYSETIADFENGKEEFDIERYEKVLKEAQKHELLKHDIILCTCSSALKPILKETMDFRQIIIDECAMATEPEAFIPLVAHNPEQIVLFGDHKQIRPIVSSARVKELGMGTSLFERYMRQALMLDTQYRMHESICEFPSKEFYEGKLKTGTELRPCLLLNKQNGRTGILFGHVEGEEGSLVVSTTDGNENSVENTQEAAQAVRVAEMLIRESRVSPEDVAILTPYNAQMSRIKKILEEKKIENVSVCTVMKSQGSEWPYVIISTVRSCPLAEIQTGRVKKKLGFVADPNQVNVAITRAQDGLCILGNRHLLKCNDLWKRLLNHYQAKNCVLDSADDIKVVKRKRR